MSIAGSVAIARAAKAARLPASSRRIAKIARCVPAQLSRPAARLISTKNLNFCPKYIKESVVALSISSKNLCSKHRFFVPSGGF